MSDELTISERDRATIARRLRRWPDEWRESHFASLPRDERKVVALLVLELDARPEFAELLPDPVSVQQSLLDEREPAEKTWPDWSKTRRGKPRELPSDVQAWMREQGMRR